jgi:simple sugar transport system ATP-binding protein
LAEVLAGQRAAISGSILLRDEEVTRGGVAARRQQGIAYITDERHGEGTIGTFSVATNLVAKEIGKPPLWWRGVSLWVDLSRRLSVALCTNRTYFGRADGRIKDIRPRFHDLVVSALG